MSSDAASRSTLKEAVATCLSNDSLHLIVLPTEACNFRCTYCYEDFRAARMRPGTVRGIKTLLARRAPGLRRLTISWFGGEPLLALDLIEDVMTRVRELTRSNPEMCVASDATTNGYLLTRPVAERLIDLGVTRYQISFDPPRERHDRLRVRKAGGATFDRIWRNLLALRASTRDFRITIRIHVDRKNAAFIDPFLDDCAAAFGSDTRFEIFIRTLARLGGANDPDLDVLDSTDERPVLEQLRAGARSRGLHTLQLPPPGSPCYAARANSYVVRADGRLNKCTVSLEHPNNQVGRILADGTVDVDSAKMGLWIRGLTTGIPAELECPMKGCADPPARPRRTSVLTALSAPLDHVEGGVRGAPKTGESRSPSASVESDFR